MQVMVHPVWHVYDELRTARLNATYYGTLLAAARRSNTIRELVTAASGSVGVAGLWLFVTPAGAVAWKILASTSAVLAVYNTVTRPSETIRRLEAQVVGWSQLEHALSEIRRRIHEAGHYDQELQKDVAEALDQKRGLLAGVPEPDVNEKLRRSCFDRVNRELPPEVFFVPDDQRHLLPPGSDNG